MTATQERTAIDAVPTQLFIGGEWLDATGGKTLDIEDPSTGETLTAVADATPEDAKAALDACCAVQDEWGRHLRHALSLDVPSLIAVPIDYSIDVSISEELGTETVAA